MVSPILTTHVGSLPRSKELSELLFKKDKGESFDKNLFDDVVNKNVKKVVNRQLDVGIDVVSDGEMSKISYATYVKDRIKGFSGESERKAPADLDDFPEYKDKIAKSGGTPTYTRPCCTSDLELQDEESLKKDISNFSNALSGASHKKGFLNAPPLFPPILAPLVMHGSPQSATPSLGNPLSSVNQGGHFEKI